MSRAPRTGEKAAEQTITIRATDDEKATWDRVLARSSPELPGASRSDRLRKLMRDLDGGVVVPLAPEDRAILDRLVSERAAKAAELGFTEARITEASMIVNLIRAAAPAPVAPSTSPVVTPEAAPAPVVAGTAADVRAALVAATDRGESQSAIGKRAGIDSGTMSKFKNGTRNLSPERLVALAKELGM